MPSTKISSSKRIGCVLGPALMAVLISEFPLVQPHLYDDQTPPVVYLSGVLMSVAGLALVRVHNLWRPDWTVLVTLSGWFLLIVGLVRMFAAYYIALNAYSEELYAADPLTGPAARADIVSNVVSLVNW
jgi:hypothetical protein